MGQIPTFTREQRATLAELISGRQIEELEAILPSIALWLQPTHPLGPVKKTISDIRKPLQKALEQIDRMTRSKESDKNMAAVAFASAGAKAGLGYDGLAPGLKRLIEACDVAAKELPDEARKRAHAMPVRMILDALRTGHDLGIVEFSSPNDEITKPMLLRAARAGEFFEIVKTCYEAATGERDIDPDRAIRNFIEQQEQEREHLTALRRQVEHDESVASFKGLIFLKDYGSR